MTFQIIPANEHHGIYIIDENGETVCDFYYIHRSTNTVVNFQNAEKNAKLLAAAPELLEVCKIIATAELCDLLTGIIDADVLEVLQIEARKVVAKAEGK